MPLVSYLRNGVLLDGKDAARKLKVQASRFVLIKDVLYKRGFSCPSLRCLGPKEADYVIREVHEGICGNNSRAQSLVHKLIRSGYYWPTMQKDEQTYVKTYDKCQRFGNVIRKLSKELTPMMSPWPFIQWGLDIMGSLPNSNQAAKVPSSWHRLLHQMGGSRSLSHYHGKEYSEFCLEEHHL